jgi:hypothetical protein
MNSAPKHSFDGWTALSSIALSSTYTVTEQTAGNYDARLIYTNP